MLNRTTLPHSSMTLKGIVLALMLLCALAAGAILVPVYLFSLDKFNRITLQTAVETRANGVQLALARALYNEWHDVAVLAKQVELDGDLSPLRARLDLIVGDGERNSWAGVAALDGTVLAASDDLLVGESVASRPWFRRGLEGKFAGDVHDAVLLANLLQPVDNQPPRFLDFATPIRNSDDDIGGVLGMHLNWYWVKAFITETSRALAVDAFLISRDSQILMSSTEENTKQLDLASARAASLGASRTFVEDWPDGTRYYSTIVPTIAYRDLPSFGWSMVVRINADNLLAPRQEITTIMLFALFALLLAFLGLGLLFNRIFSKPFAILAQSADAIADGRESYPGEYRRTQELDRLSSALVRIQSRLDYTDDTNRASN